MHAVYGNIQDTSEEKFDPTKFQSEIVLEKPPIQTSSNRSINKTQDLPVKSVEKVEEKAIGMITD